jgi:hypothetical protein
VTQNGRRHLRKSCAELCRSMWLTASAAEKKRALVGLSRCLLQIEGGPLPGRLSCLNWKWRERSSR